jgi:uncharacterized RDD family membrane protein YckC
MESSDPVVPKSATFLRRLAAYMIDIVPITMAVAAYLLFLDSGFGDAYTTFFEDTGDPAVRAQFYSFRNQARDASFLLDLLIAAVAECSPWQATMGKVICSVRVIGPDGGRISVRRSAIRNGAKLLSALPLGLGFLWALFSKDRRTWHDKWTDTRVVRD